MLAVVIKDGAAVSFVGANTVLFLIGSETTPNGCQLEKEEDKSIILSFPKSEFQYKDMEDNNNLEAKFTKETHLLNNIIINQDIDSTANVYHILNLLKIKLIYFMTL